MSPTMTEGGIAGWKKKEGEIFVAGDVLLEIVCLSASGQTVSPQLNHAHFPLSITGNGQGHY